MLNKIFGNKKSSDISKVSTRGRQSAATPADRESGRSQRQSRAVKIVHAGGHVEHYYMATPASMVMQKHPSSFVLARPEIFRRPWDSVVGSDEILVPGQKYYVVPRRTVKKLRRRIRKPIASTTGPGFGFSLTENASKSSSISSFSGILVKPGIKAKARNLHVRFFGIDAANQQDGHGHGHGGDDHDAVSKISTKKSGNKSLNGSKMINQKKERARIQFAWEPALQSITE